MPPKKNDGMHLPREEGGGGVGNRSEGTPSAAPAPERQRERAPDIDALYPMQINLHVPSSQLARRDLPASLPPLRTVTQVVDDVSPILVVCEPMALNRADARALNIAAPFLFVSADRASRVAEAAAMEIMRRRQQVMGAEGAAKQCAASAESPPTERGQ